MRRSRPFAALAATSRVVVVAGLLVTGGGPARAGTAPDLGERLDRCGELSVREDRLACFDALAAERRIDAAREVGVRAASRVHDRWDRDDAAAHGVFALLPHEANYLLPVTYNFRPNQRPFPRQLLDVQPVEAKFQLSFKLKLAERPFATPGDLWLTYTQKSFWQVYNGGQSAPFRETDYNPGLSYVVPTGLRLGDTALRAVAVTVDHQSNGRGAGLSRSWNRLAATAVLERGEFVGLVSAWATQGTDDNPDITDYLGHGRVLVGWRRGGHVLSLAVRNPFDVRHGRLGTEASWSFPLPFTGRVKGYVQYDYGYGESLLDYDAIGHRVGIGVALSDPL